MTENKHKYIGDRNEDGQRHGNGICTYNNGDKYIGEWREDYRHGNGMYILANGEKYIGEYKDDKRNGHGEYTFPEGQKYIGEWKDDKRDGHGEYTLTDGTVVKKFYKDGEEISEQSFNESINEITEIAQKEIEEDPSFTIEILEEFLDYEIPPNPKLEHIKSEIENAEEELFKLMTDFPQMTRLANRVQTKIRELHEIIKEQNIKERPYPSEKYQLDGASKRQYLNSLKEYECGLCGKYHLVFKTEDSKKWTCPSTYCKGSQWPNFAEMEFLNLTFKR